MVLVDFWSKKSKVQFAELDNFMPFCAVNQKDEHKVTKIGVHNVLEALRKSEVKVTARKMVVSLGEWLWLSGTDLKHRDVLCTMYSRLLITQAHLLMKTMSNRLVLQMRHTRGSQPLHLLLPMQKHQVPLMRLKRKSIRKTKEIKLVFITVQVNV